MSDKKYFTSKDARALINTYGLAIFPVHGITPEGVCTCGNPACTNRGKHPATVDGFKSATKDINKLLEVWAARKYLNVGIATGAESGIFVIDIDSAEGEKNLLSLGDIPKTLTALTGKGKHLYFKHPGTPVITKRGIIQGVDVRGDGGYVCGPGSNHTSGSRYQWDNPLEEIAAAPDFILDLVVKSRIRTDQSPAINLGSPKTLLLSDKWTYDDVQDHLAHIDPDCGYDEWISVGMALQSEGVPFSVWDAWSARGIKYKPQEMAAHWKSFRPNGGVSYGTIVHMAKQGGWGAGNRKYQQHTAPAPYQESASEFVDPETGEIVIAQSTATSSTSPAQPQQKILPLVYASDITPSLDTRDFVEGLLCDREFSVVYGESNCGKTFFMLDLAMHVATGMQWRSRAVEQGGVVYAALEGGHGTRNRVYAFKQRYGITKDIPLAIIPASINLLDQDIDLPAFCHAIRTASERIGNVRLLVVDTLARAISGGDENSSVDMGQLVIHADYIRAQTGAHIAFIHHSGKDTAKGARGHSSLRAAVDTEIEISRPDTESPSAIKVVKQREMEMIEDMAFSLSRVVLGVDRRGKEVTSCVVEPVEYTPESKPFKMNPVQKFIFDALIDATIRSGVDRVVYKDARPVKCVSYDELRDAMEERGYREMMEESKKTTAAQIKSATQTARLALQNAGKINFNGKFIWLTETAEKDKE